METVSFLTFLLVMAELFEASIQYSKTLFGVLEKLYIYYQKSIFLFFLIHPGFYLLLFIVLFTGTLNISMVFLLIMKIFDIFYKMELIKKVFVAYDISPEMERMLEIKIPPFFFLMGVVFYPPILYYALI